MSRQERYGTRDLAFSAWHRLIPRDDFTWIDIDHFAYCDKCKDPIYVAELALDVGQEFKPTTITKRIAVKLAIPGILILYTVEDEAITSFRVKQIAPKATGFHRVKPQALVDWITKTRDEHVCVPANGIGAGKLETDSEIVQPGADPVEVLDYTQTREAA